MGGLYISNKIYIYCVHQHHRLTEVYIYVPQEDGSEVYMKKMLVCLLYNCLENLATSLLPIIYYSKSTNVFENDDCGYSHCA